MTSAGSGVGVGLAVDAGVADGAGVREGGAGGVGLGDGTGGDGEARVELGCWLVAGVPGATDPGTDGGPGLVDAVSTPHAATIAADNRSETTRMRFLWLTGVP